jgi:hypothetical protein
MERKGEGGGVVGVEMLCTMFLLFLPVFGLRCVAVVGFLSYSKFRPVKTVCVETKRTKCWEERKSGAWEFGEKREGRRERGKGGNAVVTKRVERREKKEQGVEREAEKVETRGMEKQGAETEAGKTETRGMRKQGAEMGAKKADRMEKKTTCVSLLLLFSLSVLPGRELVGCRQWTDPVRLTFVGTQDLHVSVPSKALAGAGSYQEAAILKASLQGFVLRDPQSLPFLRGTVGWPLVESTCSYPVLETVAVFREVCQCFCCLRLLEVV